MSQTIMLELPEDLLQRAQGVAIHTKRRVEDVLVEWIDRASADVPVDLLADEAVLLLCDLQMTDAQQQELNQLLARNGEGQLNESAEARLDELMDIYHETMLRKSEALRVAVQRGLPLPLN